jgi:hypothetical protein
MSYLDLLDSMTKDDDRLYNSIKEVEQDYLILRKYYINLLSKAKHMDIEEYEKDLELQNKIIKCVDKLQNSILTDCNCDDILEMPTIKGVDLNSKYELTKYTKKGYKLVFETERNNFKIGIMEQLRYADVQDIVSFKDYQE